MLITCKSMLYKIMSGSRLLSHAVSSIVPSAARIFTVVFGMGTGRTDLHRRVRDGNGCCLRTHRHQTKLSKNIQSFGKPPRCSALRAPASLQTFASRCACAPLYAHVCTLVKASYMLVRARHPLGFSSLFSSHENPTETQPLLSSLERR